MRDMEVKRVGMGAGFHRMSLVAKHKRTMDTGVQAGVYIAPPTPPPPPTNPPSGSISPASQTVSGPHGQPITFHATMSGSGGKPPYNYVWHITNPSGTTVNAT